MQTVHATTIVSTCPTGCPDVYAAEFDVGERRFRVGQRVRLSPKGRQDQPRLVQTGTVVGLHAQWHDCIKVLRDGNKTPSFHHESMWEPLPDATDGKVDT